MVGGGIAWGRGGVNALKVKVCVSRDPPPHFARGKHVGRWIIIFWGGEIASGREGILHSDSSLFFTITFLLLSQDDEL